MDFFNLFFFSSRRRHTRCALVTGVQTCALPIWPVGLAVKISQPVSVMPMLCSNCAESERSRVTAVQPSLSIFTAYLPVLIIGSIVKNMPGLSRSEEHTSELQSLMRILYAVFCLINKKNQYADTTEYL